MQSGRPARFLFGNFVCDLANNELYEGSKRVPLQEKPFQFLRVLLESRGAVVTREELSRRMWPDTHVQVNQGLNAAARKIRMALGDQAAQPRYVETLGSRGYRFIAPFTELPGRENDNPEAVRTSASPGNPNQVPFSVHEHYLRGRHFWNQRTPQGLIKGLEYFREALAQDPTYALAHAGMADTYNLLATHAMMLPKTGYELAKEEAACALQLQPNLPEAHVAMGWAKLSLNGDREGAKKHVDRAIELNPRYAFARNAHSYLLMASGELQEAIKAMQHGRELDPLSLILNALLSNCYYYAREYENSAKQAERTIELDSRFPVAHACLGLAYLGLNRAEEAVQAFEKATLLSKESPIMVAHLAYGLAIAGNRKRAAELISALSEAQDHLVPPSFHIGLVHIQLGNVDEGVRWLERACNERFHWTLYMDIDPRLDELRSDSRYTRIRKDRRNS